MSKTIEKMLIDLKIHDGVTTTFFFFRQNFEGMPETKKNQWKALKWFSGNENYKVVKKPSTDGVCKVTIYDLSKKDEIMDECIRRLVNHSEIESDGEKMKLKVERYGASFMASTVKRHGDALGLSGQEIIDRIIKQAKKLNRFKELCLT